MIQVVLASGSPRRAQIMQAIGVPCRVAPQKIDESLMDGESVVNYVERLSREKAESALGEFCQSVIIGADTVVVLGDLILEKPKDRAAGTEMLSLLSGRRHLVFTGLTVLYSSLVITDVVTTEVVFRDISKDEMELYWETGEPEDKAGGYGLQGIGGTFVTSIRGSYSGVMGLPVFETERALQKAGLDTWRYRIGQ